MCFGSFQLRLNILSGKLQRGRSVKGRRKTCPSLMQSAVGVILREIAHQGPSLLAWVLLQPRMLSEASRCEGFCPFFWCAVFRWLHKLDILSCLLLEWGRLTEGETSALYHSSALYCTQLQCSRSLVSNRFILLLINLLHFLIHICSFLSSYNLCSSIFLFFIKISSFPQLLLLASLFPLQIW